jgi:hypothetical protein
MATYQKATIRECTTQVGISLAAVVHNAVPSLAGCLPKKREKGCPKVGIAYVVVHELASILIKIDVEKEPHACTPLPRQSVPMRRGKESRDRDRQRQRKRKRQC